MISKEEALNYHAQPVPGKLTDEQASIRRVLELHIGVDCQICHSVPFNANTTSAQVRFHARYGSRNELVQLVEKVQEKDRKQVAKMVTVSTALGEIENAVRKQREVVADRETELQTLEEIERSVREMREELRRREQK